jgi:hypothetical protein
MYKPQQQKELLLEQINNDHVPHIFLFQLVQQINWTFDGIATRKFHKESVQLATKSVDLFRSRNQLSKVNLHAMHYLPFFYNV